MPDDATVRAGVAEARVDLADHVSGRPEGVPDPTEGAWHLPWRLTFRRSQALA